MEKAALAFLVSLAVLMISSIIFYLWLALWPKGEADLSEIEEADEDLRHFKVKFLGWVVGYSEDSVPDYYEHHEKFTWVSPTWYEVDGNGEVREENYREDLVEKSREWGVKVIPLIANSGFSSAVAHSILSDEKVRDRVIKSIVRIVLEKGYDGINIDFEGIDPSDRGNLTEFMRILHSEMSKHGKIVSIDVPAKTHETYEGWSGAYDYRELSRYVDLFVIMIYDYHWSGGRPGPISPLDWFERVIGYALENVPREKIVAGIPFYGYDWPASGKGRGVTYADAIDLATRFGAAVKFDWDSGEAYFSYTAGFERHDVWFNIAKSTELRIERALEMGVDKIAAWRIGQEDPKTWNVISKADD